MNSSDQKSNDSTVWKEAKNDTAVTWQIVSKKATNSNEVAWHSLSKEATEFILSQFQSIPYKQIGHKNVWTDGKIVIKIYPNKQYFLEILYLHSLLDRTYLVSQLKDSVIFGDEHIVVEWFVPGKTLKSIYKEDESYILINFFIEQLEKEVGKNRSDWDFNPSNYIIDDKMKITMVDLGDCYFK
jgi:hypothetical protein